MSRETPLKLLDEMVEKLGQTEVARLTGYSKGAICHVQKGSYKGSTAKVLRRIEEIFSQRPVECPVLGDIPYSRCVQERNRPFAATNPLRVRLAKTCRSCEVKGL